MVLFIGNLNVLGTRKDLLKLFGAFGVVEAVQIVTDNITNRSRGFAYIRMADAASAFNAIENLHNTRFMGKLLIVTDKGPLHEVRTSLSVKKK